jgi:hypothetical protein
MKNTLVWIFIAGLAACSHGRTAHFPQAADPAQAAEVFVIRDNTLLGWGLSVKVLLDEEVIAHLRAGEHLSFQIAPGIYRIGITESTITAAFESGRAYYYLIGTDDSPSGFRIERLDAGRGRAWVSKTTALP